MAKMKRSKVITPAHVERCKGCLCELNDYVKECDRLDQLGIDTTAYRAMIEQLREGFTKIQRLATQDK